MTVSQRVVKQKKGLPSLYILVLEPPTAAQTCTQHNGWVTSNQSREQSTFTAIDGESPIDDD